MAASSSHPASPLERNRSFFQIPTRSSSRYGKASLISGHPTLLNPYLGGREAEPSFTATAAKIGGTAIGTLYQKESNKPGKVPTQYLGKIGIGRGVYTSDPHTYRTRTKKEMNGEVIHEKIAYDLYRVLGRDLFKTPKTYLSRQPIADPFTRFHPLVLFLLGTPAELSQAGFSDSDAPPVERRLTNESLRIMSSFIPGYQDLGRGDVLFEGVSVPFIDYLATAHRPPESLLTPEGKEVPIRGLMALLAVGRVLADTDMIGGEGGNAGFIWIRDEKGEIVAAQVVKIDPGMAFQFGTNNEVNWAANSYYQRRTRSARHLDDVKDLQIAQNYDPITIHWERLTPPQKIEFLKTFYLSTRFIHSEEGVHYLFYRDNHFHRSETEQNLESEARETISQLRGWLELQEGTYGGEMIGREEELIESISSEFELISQEEQLEILEDLLLSFPHLTKLKLSSLKISDESLLRLVQQAPRLEELTLVSSQSISKDGLMALFNSHPRLALTLTDRHPISPTGLAELIEFAWDPSHRRALSFLIQGVKISLLQEQRDQLLRQSLISRAPSLALGEALLIRGATITPLLLKEAVEQSSREGLSLLLARFEGFREVRVQEESLLHYAARANRGDQIQLLYESGFQEVNLRGAREQTPFHVAAQNQGVEAARALLGCGANPMLVDCDLKTVLHLAIHPLPNLEMVKLLLGVEGEIGQRDGAAPAHLTQWQINFLEMGDRIAPRNRWTPPLLTRRQKQLLNRRDDVELLFSSLTPEEQERLRAENELLWRESLELINLAPLPLQPWQRELLFMGDSDGKVPLHFAALQRDPHFAYLLLRAGTPPNTTNSHGYTPLHWAAMHNFPETAELLLVAGARTAILNRNQETPFNLALRYRSQQVARLLISPQLIPLANMQRNDSDSDSDDALPMSSSSSSSTQVVRAIPRERGEIEQIFALEEQSQQAVERGDYRFASTTLASALKLADSLSISKDYLAFLELQLDWIANSFLLNRLEIKTPPTHTCQIGLYREELRAIRSRAELTATVQEQQALLSRGYREVVAALFHESLFLMLHPVDRVGRGEEERQKGLSDYSLDELNRLVPSKYALLSLDQLSRGDGFPITEIRFAIAVENPDAIPFFENVAQLLEMKVVHLGESGEGLGFQPGGEHWFVGTPAQIADKIGTAVQTTRLAGFESTAKKERDCSNKMMGWDKWFGEIPGKTKAIARLNLSLDRWRALQEEASIEIGLYRPLETALRYLQLYFNKSSLSPREGIQALPFRGSTKTALLEAFNQASSLIMRSQFAQLRGEEFLPDPREVAAIRAVVASLYQIVERFVTHPGSHSL